MPARSPDFGKTWGNQNCYAYAISNDGSNTGTLDVESGRNPSNITPGQFSGDYDLDVNDAQEMDRAIVRDKAIRACPQNAPALPAVGSKPGYYLMACKCGGGNYHFVRRDENDGSWWQKMPMTGPGSAAIVDGFTPHVHSWNPPAVDAALPAHLGRWVGYYWVPEAGLPIRTFLTAIYERCNIM